MCGAFQFSFLLMLSFLHPHSPALEEGYLVLFVTNTKEEPVSNIAITCKGDCSEALAIRGRVRLKLPAQTRPGEWVTLQIAKRSGGLDWVLISPWHSRTIVPLFDNKADNAVPVVVARRGDKQMLTSGKALEAITARILNEVNQNREISDKERKLVLIHQAEAVGLTPEEVDRAIRERASKARDPYQRALAALYEKNFPKATELLTQSYEMRKETAQKANTEYADAAFFLGQSLYQQGKYSTAVDKFQEVIALRKDDSDVLNWLGLSLHQGGRYAEAELAYQHALVINEKTSGKEHPDTATSLNNLAGLYNSQGRYAEAEPLVKRALAIREKTLGKEYAGTARSLNNLAAIYYSQGRYAEAEPLFKRALAIHEKLLGEDPETALSLNNLAGLYSLQGRYAEAEPLFKRALDIYEKVLGKEHPFTANSLNNLAGLYYSQGRYAEAEPLFKRALEINETTLGKQHPKTAISLNNLADIYTSQGRYAEAEPLFKRVIEIFQKTLGEEHPDTATSLNNLSRIYYLQGRYAEAEPLVRHALAIREKVLGKHPDTANSLNNVAKLCYSLGRYSEAEPLYQRSLIMFEETLGKEHPILVATLENYAALLRKMNRADEAAKLEARARQIRLSTTLQRLTWHITIPFPLAARRN